MAAGFFGNLYLNTSGSGQIESIAVMPFVNESGNPDIGKELGVQAIVNGRVTQREGRTICPTR